MADLGTEIDALARSSGFAGVVSVSRGTEVTFERAYGLADRAHRIPATVETRFGIASGTKAFTALTVESLIAEGLLNRTTTARSVLGGDLPLVGADVTVEHLLTHTSGVGDYVDEDVIAGSVDNYVLGVPVHRLDTTPGYLAALDGIPPKFPAGRRFAYSNSGYVVLALIAERVAGRSFPGLVGERVLGPAEMFSSAFLRMDALPGDAAIGYLQNGRTNVLHLPVRGSGDGGRSPRWPTCGGSGRRCSPDGCCRSSASASWFARDRTPAPAACATGSGSGPTRRAELPCSPAATPGSRSSRCTTRTRD